MIVKNTAEQWVGCDLCGEQTELSRRTMQNPETVLMMVEELKRDHKDCEQYAHDPRMAALQRGYKRRMCREFAGAGREQAARGSGR